MRRRRLPPACARPQASSASTASTVRSSSRTTAVQTAASSSRRRRARGSSRSAEKGYGNALMGGIVAAQGRYVIMGDADDSYDFTALMPFVVRASRRAPTSSWVTGSRAASPLVPCGRCTAIWAIRCSASSGGCSSASRSATSTVVCADSAGTACSRSACRRRAWSSRARWSSRPRWPGNGSSRCRPRCHRTAAAAHRICVAGAMAGGTCGSCSCSARAGCS